MDQHYLPLRVTISIVHSMLEYATNHTRNGAEPVVIIKIDPVKGFPIRASFGRISASEALHFLSGIESDCNLYGYVEPETVQIWVLGPNGDFVPVDKNTNIPSLFPREHSDK